MAIEDTLAGLARIVDGSSSNSTMKWVLLWSLLDASPLLADNSPDNALPLAPVAQAARRAIAPQLREYLDRGVLSQVNTAGARPRLFQQDVSNAEAAWILAQWPVPRLQSVGGLVQEVLWRVPDEWRSHTQAASTRNKPVPKKFFCKDSNGLPVLQAVPGAMEDLVRLAPLLKPAVETRWRDEIRKRNKYQLGDLDPDLRLDHFLFPNSRRTWPEDLRVGLNHIQTGLCFWCRKENAVTVVDHVIPWSISRNDAIENLVLTHRECNEVKSDLPLTRDLQELWWSHLNDKGRSLRELAEATALTSDLELTRAWARSSRRLWSGRAYSFGVVDFRPIRVEGLPTIHFDLSEPLHTMG